MAVILAFANSTTRMTFATDGQDELSMPPIPKPPLTMKTSNGGYTVTIDWQPRDPIEPYPHYNVTTSFVIKIADQNGTGLANTPYSVIIKDSDLKVIIESVTERTDDKGVGRPVDVQFKQNGIAHFTVCLPNPSGAINSDRCANFGILVVPEFPAIPIAVLTISITSIIVISRFKPQASSAKPQ